MEEINAKLDLILRNQYLILKVLDRMITQEHGPSDLIQNMLANLITNQNGFK